MEAPKPRRFMVNKNFTLRINGVSVPFQAGQIVDNEPVIVRLEESRVDMTLITSEDDIGTCPHCGKSFSMESQRGARSLLARARQLMPGYR